MITQTFAALAGAILLSDPGAAPRPQDDFFAHVNAQWLAETEIPPHVPWISPFVENTLAIQDEVRAVIEDVVRDPDAFGAQGRNIAAYWTSLTVSRSNETLQSLRREFDRIGALDGPADIAGAMCRLHARHSDFDVNAITPGVTPVWLGVRARPDDPGRQVLHVEPAGLGLPDPAYYVEAGFAQERIAYRAMTANVLRAVGVEASAREREVVFDLEAELAAARLSEAERHDASATLSIRTASTESDGFAWSAYFEGCGLAPPDVWLVADERYFTKLDEIMRRYDPEFWALYFKLKLAVRYAPVLSEEMNAVHFGFFGETLLGADMQRPAADRAALAVEAAFGAEIEQYWLDRYFNPVIQREVAAMAEDIRAAYAARLQATTLLSEQSRAEALAKLAALNVQVGHPVGAQPAQVGTLGLNAVDNLIDLRRSDFETRMARANRPTDRDRWYAPAWDTSGYYVRSTNTLALPAGLLRSPWFSLERSDIENLAGIGTVIAHEMGHAFDNQGSQHDAEGRLRDWWTPEDRLRFDAELEKLVTQYSRYEILPGAYLNGELTVSEAFADLAGLTVAHDAMIAALGEVSPAERQVATRVFLEANCAMKRALYTDQLLGRILATEGHAPQRIRCNAPLSAFARFYELFTVGPGDQMYLPAEARPSPW